MKRTFDLLLAIALLLPTSIIVAVAAVAVMLDSRGSPLFLQTRVGRFQKQFRMIKLRTMAVGTETAASHEVGSARITKIGGFLRRTKIDELPQIWSILRGDMSFVGPRPCLPIQKELIAERAKLGVFGVLPGITGKAQALGVDMSQPALLATIDAEYVAEQSLMEDLRIIWCTVAGGGYHDAAGQSAGSQR